MTALKADNVTRRGAAGIARIRGWLATSSRRSTRSEVSTLQRGLAIGVALATVVGPVWPSAVGRATECIDISQYIHLVGQVPTGVNEAAAVSGSHVYAIGYDGLTVVDVSNPTEPTVVGNIDTPGAAVRLAVRDSLVYIADGTAGLGIYSVANPSAPSLVGSVDTPDVAVGVAVSLGVACVADYDRLQVVDVQDPSSPQIVGSLGMPAPGAVDVAMKDRYAYVASGWPGVIRVVDVTVPSAPAASGVFSLGETDADFRGITIQGSYAHMASLDGIFYIVDLEGQGGLELAGSVEVAGNVMAVAVHGVYAYLRIDVPGLPGGGYLQIVDVSDPTNPVVVGALACPGGLNAKVCVSEDGEYAYSGRTWVVDVSGQMEVPLVGSVGLPGSPRELAVYGAYVIAASSAAGLQVITTQDPIEVVGSVDTDGDAGGVATSGEYAYVADGNVGLCVVDLSTLTEPTIVGVVDTPGYARSVTVVEPFAYVADWTEGVQIVDVSNSALPMVVASVSIPSYARGVLVSGEYLYVAADAAGLQIVDTSDPLDPVLVGGVVTPGDALRTVLLGTRAYVAQGSDGVAVVDVSDPMNPVYLMTIELPGTARDVDVMNEYLCVADDAYGVQVLDVSGPTPFLVGALGSPRIAARVAVSGAVAYVASESPYEMLAFSPDCSAVVGVALGDAGLQEFDMRVGCRPNPVHATPAMLSFSVPRSGVTRLSIYDASGRLVARPFDGFAAQGQHEVPWAGLASGGSDLGSGVYFLELESGGARTTARAVLIR